MVAVTVYVYDHIIGLPPRRQTFESQMGLLFLIWLRYVAQPMFLENYTFFLFDYVHHSDLQIKQLRCNWSADFQF